ncbi:MAG TPA: hypothetical protein VJM80_11150 [bacterium]|nr:hypothetical protein [bacterium]
MRKEKYVTDATGKEKAVLLESKEYKRLLAALEDLADAKDVLMAEREAEGFIPYDQFRKTFLKKRQP